MTEAAKLLGYPYSMSGEVIHGAGRGKTINFPTANVDYPKEKAAPPNGIYACWAKLGNERFMAATNIGLTQPLLRNDRFQASKRICWILTATFTVK